MSGQKARNSDGKFESDHGVDTQQILDSMDYFVPYTTGEIAKNHDIPRRTAYKYLEELHGSDKISKKKPEPRRAIWTRGK